MFFLPLLLNYDPTAHAPLPLTSFDTFLKTKTLRTSGEEKQNIPKIESKKIEPEKINPPKAIEPTQPPANKLPVEDQLAKALDIQQPVVPMEQVKEVQKPHIPPMDNNAHISNNFREVEALRRGAQLQKELVQKWLPPIGVSPNCTCEISFFVNNKGAIENLKMVKSSGVMMFDISARQALFTMKMPQWTYGNPLTITFKQ